MIQTIIVIALVLAAIALFVYLLRRQTRDEACAACPARDLCRPNHPTAGCKERISDDSDRQGSR